jgi:glycosyltransferase involved in cell wall biosynthesis
VVPPGIPDLVQAASPRLTRNSRLVITVSEFSRKRIVERLGIASDRIAVLPGGVDQSVFYPREPDEVHAALKRFGIEGDYLLAVGTIQPRKNLPGLIKAWEVVRKVFPDLSWRLWAG